MLVGFARENLISLHNIFLWEESGSLISLQHFLGLEHLQLPQVEDLALEPQQLPQVEDLALESQQLLLPPPPLPQGLGLAPPSHPALLLGLHLQPQQLSLHRPRWDSVLGHQLEPQLVQQHRLPQVCLFHNWAAARQTVSSGIYDEVRLKSACSATEAS